MVSELLGAHSAYSYARKKILDGTCIAGARLTTKDLPLKIGKRRAALRQLEADGLVVLKPHGGALVRPLDPQEFKDLCGARQALEVYAAGLAAENRNEAQVEDLRRPLLAIRRILDGMRDPTFDEDLLNDLVRADIKFHLQIVEIAGNSWLKREVMRLRVLHRVIATALKSKPIHTLDEHRRVQSCHEEIFEAIVHGDCAAAKEAMERHLQGNPLRFRR